MTRKERYARMLDYFRKNVGNVTTELNFTDAYQLIVAVILSAQCTDVRINKITPELFKRYPAFKDLAVADIDEVQEYVKSVSYPNSKAKHIVGMARMVVSDFDGVLPEDIRDLMKLPGVGRKTANVIQAVWYGKAAMAVDTHVYRVSHRLGLVPSTANTPYKVEQELMKHISQADMSNAHHWILLHGRYVCTSREPHCDKCPFDSFCPKLLENSKLK